MSITDYHANYLAYELAKRRSSDSGDKLAAAAAGAQVDLNPHQADAALFAFRSPLSKGALLADESQHNEKRRSLFKAQDKVDHQREELIANIEGKLTQNSRPRNVFTIRWTLA